VGDGSPRGKPIERSGAVLSGSDTAQGSRTLCGRPCRTTRKVEALLY
jgi:hypothetical protein